MRIERAEVIPLEVPLARTFYGGTYSMNRRCTLLLRVWTAEGIRGQIYIGDERDQQAAVCRILREELFPSVLGRQASEVTAIWEEHFRRTTVSAGRRAMMQALSALDVVLWDVIGRHAGLPVFRLLGAAQTRLQTIVIGGYYAEEKGVASQLKNAKKAGVVNAPAFPTEKPKARPATVDGAWKPFNDLAATNGNGAAQ